MRILHWFLVLSVGITPFAYSQTQSNSGDEGLVARWDFGEEETTPLMSHGGVHRDIPGPRPPDYPDFELQNTAVKFDGNGAYLFYDDPGSQSPFDFTQGDAITLEAWIQVDDLKSGENAYVIGKGRTGNPGFAVSNQNWALRVREKGGKAALNFLFATPPRAGDAADGHWHRWTSNQGFAPGKTWHHIAIAYRFGHPESIRGWIDGKPTEGIWDMGGATQVAPVVDNDAIWIGSSQGGAASNSFRGSMDSVAIHRRILDDATIKSRYRFTGVEVVQKPAPEIMPTYDSLPNRVLFTVHEGMPSHDRWLMIGEKIPDESLRWEEDYFLIDRLPQRFDAWGIRDQWKAPVLVRMIADIDVDAGTHRLLMRTRGLSRLWVDGKIVARAKPIPGSPSGEEPMTPVAEPPLPGLRIAEHRQQEVIGEFHVERPSRCRVILETLVGGKAYRTDPGEQCIAIESKDPTTFCLLQSASSDVSRTELKDRDVLSALARQEQHLSATDDARRRKLAQSRDNYWQERHAFARQWVHEHHAIPVPPSNKHPIDAFLQSKIDRALAASATTTPEASQEFHQTVLPILRRECFRCHGEKESGGLRLNSRDAILHGGDSGESAVQPGKPDESELIRRLRSQDPDERMPPGEQPMAPEHVRILEQWIAQGASWPAPIVDASELQPPDVIADHAFLRRVYLDTVGVLPTDLEAKRYLDDPSPDKRRHLVDRLLTDERWADHWMSYWQDVLAENPTLLNSSLNTTGPFRWFLYDAIRDEKPMDRIVTELVLLRGSPHEGGSAGFGLAGDNDAPSAAKGQILANAFLGLELQCARCHDSPYHSTKQKDLYALAAMLDQKTITVPKTSRVPAAFFENKVRESLIQVTLKHDEPIAPEFPFGDITGYREGDVERWIQNPKDSRERLAVHLTGPTNFRFAQVLANRVWAKLIGVGMIDPVSDWEGHAPSHPEMLDWLASEFMQNGYSLKHIARLILTSEIYQRQAIGKNRGLPPEDRFFLAPERRRMTAEQIVDSLYAAAGRSMDIEEMTFDPDGRRPSSNRLTLGVPRRAWMLANLANERDRPSLNLPKAQALTDILLAFGWSGARQNPRTDRETDPNVLQPGVMANSTASLLLTRVVEGSALSQAAHQVRSPEELVEFLYLRYLSRLPTPEERKLFAAPLAQDFENRIVQEADQKSDQSLREWPVLPKVTWSNHLQSQANVVALEMEKRARAGTPPATSLRAEWREMYEDVLWSIINIREFVWMP